MTDMDIRSLWQKDPADFQLMSMDELHAQAARFSHAIRNRNRREYFAGFVVILAFSCYAWVFPSLMVKAGSLLTAAAALFVIWQLDSRTSQPDAAAEAGSVVDHYRQRLVAERNALASVPSWYLAPFIPGFVLFSIGKALERAEFSWAWLALQLGVPTLVFVGIWLLNRSGARQLQRKIDALDFAASSAE